LLLGSAAIILLLVTLPSFPAAWRGLANLSAIGDAAPGGVVVKQCVRGELVLDWTCHGTWTANDPMADPVGPKEVTLMNNARFLSKGSDLGFVYVKPGTHEGFNAGAMVQVKTVTLWLGVLCLLTTLILLIATRRSRVLWPSVVALTLGSALITSAWGIIA
jgi:hypothetical protein